MAPPMILMHAVGVWHAASEGERFSKMLPVWISTSAVILGPLVFIAYRHPDSYEKIWPKLMYIGLACIAIAAAYDIGITNAESSLRPFIENDKIRDAGNAIKQDKISFPYAIIGYFGMMIILFFLSMMNNLGIVSEKYLEEKKKKEEELDARRKKEAEEDYHRALLQARLDLMRTQERPPQS